MGQVRVLSKERWNEAVGKLISIYNVYAPVQNWGNLDYDLIDAECIDKIVYNHARPTTPLKSFFLPIKDNVSKSHDPRRKVLIFGVPACDLEAIGLLDAIYLEETFPDRTYESRRNQSVLAGGDCYTTLEYCHCTTCGVQPYPQKYQDLVINLVDDHIVLETATEKGEGIVADILEFFHASVPLDGLPQSVEEKRSSIIAALTKKNKDLPGFEESGKLIKSSKTTIWRKYATDCVSCGACSTSCPTCTCFLLIDRPGFEKIRNVDTCQHPGFEKVAAGEDPLEHRPERFKNRYLCKYAWKPSKYDTLSCTGCGRCIDACIGDINKNKLLIELKGVKNE